MDIQVHITVHAFGEEKLCDDILDQDSDSYGNAGKEIVEPLRAINGEKLQLADIDEEYKVCDFWKWISNTIYPQEVLNNGNTNQRLDFTRKYLVFDGVRYYVNDESKSLLYYLAKMKSTNCVEVQLLLCLDAGTVFTYDGIRYYMNSHEQCSHNKAHVHVDIRHQYSGAFSIVDGEQLTDAEIPQRYVKKIQEIIKSRRKELLEYWNDHTDGLDVDLNQVFGLIHY